MHIASGKCRGLTGWRPACKLSYFTWEPRIGDGRLCLHCSSRARSQGFSCTCDWTYCNCTPFCCMSVSGLETESGQQSGRKSISGGIGRGPGRGRLPFSHALKLSCEMSPRWNTGRPVRTRARKCHSRSKDQKLVTASPPCGPGPFVKRALLGGTPFPALARLLLRHVACGRPPCWPD